MVRRGHFRTMRALAILLIFFVVAIPVARADASCSFRGGLDVGAGGVGVTVYFNEEYPVGVIVYDGGSNDICTDQTLESAGVPHR